MKRHTNWQGIVIVKPVRRFRTTFGREYMPNRPIKKFEETVSVVNNKTLSRRRSRRSVEIIAAVTDLRI